MLERSSRRVALTPAGEVLLHEGRRALDAVAAATRRAQRAGRSDRPLMLAMKPGGDAGLLTGILAAYESLPGATAVDVVIGAAGEQTSMLRDGRADVGLLRTPHNDLTGFVAEELLVEGQVVVLPQSHPLAGQATVSLADLSGETMPRWPGVPTDGPDAPDVHDIGQLMQHIALGQMVALVPESVRGHLRHDLVVVPVVGAPPTTVVVAWPEGGRSPRLWPPSSEQQPRWPPTGVWSLPDEGSTATGTRAGLPGMWARAERVPMHNGRGIWSRIVGDRALPGTRNPLTG